MTTHLRCARPASWSWLWLSWLALAATACAARAPVEGAPPAAAGAAPALRAPGGAGAEQALPPPSEHATTSVPPAQGQASATARTPRMIVKNAQLDVLTGEPQAGFQKAVQMAQQMGGYTLSASHSEGRSSVTLRIPSARFEEALRRLAKLGKVERRDVSGNDVTAEFVDLSLRLRTTEQVRQRYLELLQRSASVTDALAVQRELERVDTTIEQLRGRINLIQNQVSFSTIELSLERPSRPGPVGWIFYGLYYGLRWLFVWN